MGAERNSEGHAPVLGEIARTLEKSAAILEPVMAVYWPARRALADHAPHVMRRAGAPMSPDEAEALMAEKNGITRIETARARLMHILQDEADQATRRKRRPHRTLIGSGPLRRW